MNKINFLLRSNGSLPGPMDEVVNFVFKNSIKETAHSSAQFVLNSTKYVCVTESCSHRWGFCSREANAQNKMIFCGDKYSEEN